MTDWKQTAKDFIAQAETMKAIELMEANGITVGSLKDDVARLDNELGNHVRNGTQFEPERYTQRLDEFDAIGRQLFDLINSAA